MKELIGKLRRFNFSRHPLLSFIGILAALLIIANIAYYFVSLYSPGCVVCHYMKPYYEQSVTSVHKDFSCVTCHPGRRILTAPYLLRYIAGSYNPRPRAEVDDDICLKCHEAQDLKKETAFEMNISFSHSDHLEDLKRGKKLRCTSCHARGEEQHFKVDKNVCFTCHFKGAERGHSATSCNVCHGIPRKIVEHGGFQFDHGSYLKIGVDCSQCHLDVTRGNAEVPKKKCYQCHIERTEEFENIDKIHSGHITQQGVDCEECHNAIEHGRVQMISTLEANCENCHKLRHTPQREMYIGSEGRGVGSIPSRMFAAQVSCEGCHLDINGDGKSDMNERRMSCVKCHSAGYDLMLDKWVTAIDGAVKSISPGLEQSRQLIKTAKQNGRNVEAEETFFTDAETNFNLVKDGRGVHNIDYALKLLENVANNIDGITSSLGGRNSKVSRSKLLSDDNEYCNLCHFAIPSKNVETFGDEKFPHQRHTKFLSCTKCHSRSEHRKLTVTSEDCKSCHQNFSKIPANIRYMSINFPHTLHSDKKEIGCTVCHASVDFSKVQIRARVCSNCHHKESGLRKNCQACHGTQAGTYSGTFLGEKFDPDIMNSGGVKCEDCHLVNNSISRPKESVCADCHDASYTTMQTEWINEIKTQLSTLSALVQDAGRPGLPDEEKIKLQKAKKLAAYIKTDGSRGIHNYMVLSSLLEKSIKEIKEISKDKN